jgi:hypothetical protein
VSKGEVLARRKGKGVMKRKKEGAEQINRKPAARRKARR